MPSAGSEHAHAGQARDADDRELNLSYHDFHSGIRVALEQVARAETAEIHPNQLEPDRRPVRRHNKSAYKTPSQPTVGKGEKDVQEEHRRYQVDGLSHRVSDVVR